MQLVKKTLSETKDYVEKCIISRLTPFVSGSPGLGKSAMVRSIANKYGLKLIDIRLSQLDPTDVSGLPSIQGGRSHYLPPSMFPLLGDPIPEGYSGFLIFFDEINSAPRSVLAAAYKIILDRAIGEYPLHPHCAIVAAGNLLDDNAIANDLGTALRSRMVHIHTKSDASEYISYALKSKYDPRIISYIEYQKNKVNTFEQFQKNSSDETFACERTWDFVNQLLKTISPNPLTPIPSEYTDLLVGTIGSTAIEFCAFTSAFGNLPKFEEIESNPLSAPMPTEPSVKYLLMTMLVSNSELSNIDTVMKYVSRFSKEYGFIFVKMLYAKDIAFIDNPMVEKMFLEIGDLLLGA